MWKYGSRKEYLMKERDRILNLEFLVKGLL